MIRRPDQPNEPHEPHEAHEPPVPPSVMSSREALAAVQDMQRECANYLERPEGEDLVRAYLGRWTREERRQIALRIMTDFMQGKTKPGEPQPAAAPERKP